MGLGVRAVGWKVGIVVLLMNLEVMKEIAVSAARIPRVLTTGSNFVLGTISASVLGVKFFRVQGSRKREILK